MFRGINKVSLDGKSRMALPARLRETVQQVSFGQLVLTIDIREKCLMLYPLCLLYTSPSPRDLSTSRMPSSA